MTWTRGRLLAPTDAPASGETIHQLARSGAVVVEQILSGAPTGVADYLQDHDEWVVVLAGAATLEVGTERLELTIGDWVMLPAGTPHRLVDTTAGTSWLAVHVGT